MIFKKVQNIEIIVSKRVFTTSTKLYFGEPVSLAGFDYLLITEELFFVLVGRLIPSIHIKHKQDKFFF